MMYRILGLLAAFAFTVLETAPVSAQSLTEEDMVQRLRNQMEMLRSAGQNGSTRSLATRGLEIVTLSEDTEGETVTLEALPDATTVASDEITPTDPNTPLTANRFAEEFEVNVSIQFELDSAAISPEERPNLEMMCRVMREASDVERFLIIGHTDSTGSEEYNERLSQLRAEEVGRFLENDCGITSSRLQTVGYGERFPAAPNDPSAAENRRVEFQAAMS